MGEATSLEELPEDEEHRGEEEEDDDEHYSASYLSVPYTEDRFPTGGDSDEEDEAKGRTGENPVLLLCHSCMDRTRTACQSMWTSELDTTTDRQQAMEWFKVARMGPGYDSAVFLVSLQQWVDRTSPGMGRVSRQQLRSGQFVEGVQSALGIQLRSAGHTADFSKISLRPWVLRRPVLETLEESVGLGSLHIFVYVYSKNQCLFATLNPTLASPSSPVVEEVMPPSTKSALQDIDEKDENEGDQEEDDDDEPHSASYLSVPANHNASGQTVSCSKACSELSGMKEQLYGAT
ncbi:hypothetical protein T265_07390 [Opisthorchis viverrini]|uniref:Uncharacterized protein n=1 Tax=Opisthorchis viverrini TaxID=6198 RepID=A0A074ZHB9_OPIVI|nr:hypothetical protein T265_07390 [Opisthorchis viverrini]KER25102.1 hypothetical protein T265_07390 [Opisthorchis viverrini]